MDKITNTNRTNHSESKDTAAFVRFEIFVVKRIRQQPRIARI